MMTTGGEVKLLDFGLARFVDQTPAELVPAELERATEPTTPLSIPEPHAEPIASGKDVLHSTMPVPGPGQEHHLESPQNRLTRVGTLMGTPLFMAPELWSGEPASALSDVYALGLLLYELLAGKLPHAQLEMTELALFVSSYDLPSLSEDLPMLPRQLTALIDRCIKREASARPSMDVIRNEMEAMVAVYLPFAGGPFEQINGDVSRVHASFLRVSRHGELLAERFYERFFVLEPSLRDMFPADIGPQARMLTKALKLTIDNLQQPERLLPFLHELGHRHAHYGVQPRHLGLMGRALLEALPMVDPEWTDSTGHAWAKAYGHIAQLLQRGIESVRASEQLPLGAVGRAHWEVPLFAPQTIWLQRPSGDLAYQSFGHGAINIVTAWEWVSNIEQIWQSPRVATFFRHLASLARVILFDRRGCGLSSAAVGASTIEVQTNDMLAIMDHAGIDRAVLLGLGDGCTPAAVLAATRPERTRALILFGGGRCIGQHGVKQKVQHQVQQRGPLCDEDLLALQVQHIRNDWGGPLFVETTAPSLARDTSYRRWWSSFLRHSASPGEAAALFTAAEQSSPRPVLSSLRVPTLVLHREEDRHRSVEDSRQMAAQIRSAQLVILPGADHLPWVGDTDAVLGALHQFLAALPSLPLSGTLAGCALAVTAAGSKISDELLQLVRRELLRGHAVTIDTPVDHVLVAYFDGPSRSVQCGLEILAASQAAGLVAAVGIDLGSLTLLPALAGEAVEQAVALAIVAAPGELLVSDSIRTLTIGPELEIGERVVAAAGEAARIVYAVRLRSASAPQRSPRSAS